MKHVFRLRILRLFRLSCYGKLLRNRSIFTLTKQIEIGEKMKKLLVVLRIIFYLLFVIGTIITMWIVYRDLQYSWTFPFVIGYVILLFLVAIYLTIISVLNLRKMKRAELGKRVKTFFGLFLSVWALNIILSFFTAGKVNVLSEIFIPLGLALGIAFVPKES